MNDCDGVKTTRQKKDSCGTTRNESPFARFFGNALRNARMMCGMTREQFAAELGISKYSIRAYEQGRRFPKYETLDSICETLGTSPEYLLCLGIMNANEFVHMLFSLENRFHLYPDMDGAIRFGMGEVQNAMENTRLAKSCLRNIKTGKGNIRQTNRRMNQGQMIPF